MNEEELPPEPQLMESLRAVGYSLEAAVADLIDNSITAQANRVEIFFSAEAEPYLAIVDDGTGMNADEARAAMCLAGTSAARSRRPDDLGRFGLGLKTASLSQCRELTVVTKREGVVTALRWDLDYLSRSRRWALLTLSEAEASNLPRYGEIKANPSGTLVVWRHLDRLPSASQTIFAKAFNEQMLSARAHLSLVFHRFLSGEDGKPKVTMELNGVRLRVVDPFLTAHRATQRGPAEYFAVAGARIDVQPFTLPHISKLTQAEKETAQIAGRLRDSQGFYIYRARRLVIWGTWFRLVPKDDLGKLARVRVDIPNTLDHLWSLDIKKSAAVPPTEIRDQLKRLVDRIVHPSQRAQLYRGRPAAASDKVVRTWNLIDERGSFRYELNREHPLLAALDEQLDNGARRLLSELLRNIESSFPVEDAYNRLGGDNVHAPQHSDEGELLDYAATLWSVFSQTGESADDFVARLRYVEPFTLSKNPEALLRRAAS
ncbi:ATP-binding protein [Micromonospora sp. NBC_00362]|uniref:ATP-binding protein n=1 Tax=Micromonospora sp. NBC_00362 TaxID=2975975 RepID=UPI002252601C|nr:ATP-binding protein [Micromonospora sp. NBC_00362]MCX5118565.1 ATP-binding protein [Micromonospora sp. NBC_00362]